MSIIRKYFIFEQQIVSLIYLLKILVVYFVLDVYVYEPYLRWTFSPYLQLAIALAGNN